MSSTSSSYVRKFGFEQFLYRFFLSLALFFTFVEWICSCIHFIIWLKYLQLTSEYFGLVFFSFVYILLHFLMIYDKFDNFMCDSNIFEFFCLPPINWYRTYADWYVHYAHNMRKMERKKLNGKYLQNQRNEWIRIQFVTFFICIWIWFGLLLTYNLFRNI